MSVSAMRSRIFVLPFLLLPTLLSSTAHADENLWGYVYGSDVLPKGANEIYLWATDRRDKGQGTYNAQDYKLELEHGFTDRLQGSLYLNGSSHEIKGAAPIENGVPEYPDRNSSGFEGVQASLKYNFLSAYKDGIGLSLYLEPGYSKRFKISGQQQDEYSLEMKLILQKNFLDDTLIWATNFTAEPERRKLVHGDGKWENELELEVSSGLSYRFARNWFAGLEARYHSEYPDWTHQFSREHYAIFFGPNIHYGGEKYWWTLTYLPQVVGAPTDDERSSQLHLGEHERREIRFKVGYNF